MAQKTAARGRPKGTGLDDAGPLAAIAELIASNPGMKPTTAIKALGITDPSTVRRLRDKYQQRHAPDNAVISEPPRCPTFERSDNVISLHTRSLSMRRETAPADAASAPPRAPAAEATDDAGTVADEHPAATKPAGKDDLFAAAYAAGISAAKTAIHVHYKSLWYAFHWSPYAFALRNTEFTRLVLLSLQDKDNDPRCSRPED